VRITLLIQNVQTISKIVISGFVVNSWIPTWWKYFFIWLK